MCRKLNENYSRMQRISNTNKKPHLQQRKCLQDAPQFAWRNQHFLQHVQVVGRSPGSNLDVLLKQRKIKMLG